MTKESKSFSDMEHLELVARRIDESGIDITSQYQDWINVTFACASLGEAARESYHTICCHYPGYRREECDAKFDNCLRTGRGDIGLGTLMQLAKDHGIDITLPRGPRPKNEAERKAERENRFRLMRQQLCLWYEFRYNTWRSRVEHRCLPMGEWQPTTDRDMSTFYARLQEQGLNVRLSDVKALLESRDFSQDYDVVLTWLNALPPYDPSCGRDYIEEFFAGHLIYGDPEYGAFYQQILKKWFVGMVALWTGKVDENPIMPVPCGAQHIGKTFFIRHILPPVLRQYYKEANPGEKVDKDFIISLSEVVMIFMDEFSISSNQKSNAYKAIISSNHSNLRDAYGHFREIRDRKASLIGASNYQEFILDREGSRRYLGMNLVGTVNLNEHPLPYEGAYAQALWLLQNGFNPKPTQEESAAITEHNHDFMVPNDCEEALMVFLRKPTAMDVPQAYTAGELMQELGNHGFHGQAYNANNIGKALKQKGFQMKKVRGQNKWLVVILDYNQQKCARVADAQDSCQAPF